MDELCPDCGLYSGHHTSCGMGGCAALSERIAFLEHRLKAVSNNCAYRRLGCCFEGCPGRDLCKTEGLLLVELQRKPK